MITHYMHKQGFRGYRNKCTRLMQKQFKIQPDEANTLMEHYGSGIHHYFVMCVSEHTAVNDIIKDINEENQIVS